MTRVQGAETPLNESERDEVATPRPASPMVYSAILTMANGVARCLDAFSIAARAAEVRPGRRAVTKATDQRTILVIERLALASAVICRRAFCSDEPLSVRQTETFASHVESFAWCARERLRALSFARELKLGARSFDRPWNEDVTERAMHGILLQIEAEAQQAFEVDEVPHELPKSKADVWRRLVDASKRYQSFPDGSVNEAAPWLLFVEFAIARREHLAREMKHESFTATLREFVDDIDKIPRTEHLNIARALIKSFGEKADDYSKSDRNRANKGRQKSREAEKKRIE